MTAPPEKAALSRELADFLIELSIALHKHAMYPEGHPLPRTGGGLRGAQLWVGLARAALVAEAVAGDDAPPPASEPTMRCASRCAIS